MKTNKHKTIPLAVAAERLDEVHGGWWAECKCGCDACLDVSNAIDDLLYTILGDTKPDNRKVRHPND